MNILMLAAGFLFGVWATILTAWAWYDLQMEGGS